MAENENKTKERNFEKTALILAVLLGMTHKSYEELAKDQTALDEITSKIHQNKSLMKAIESDEPLSDAQV